MQTFQSEITDLLVFLGFGTSNFNGLITYLSYNKSYMNSLPIRTTVNLKNTIILIRYLLLKFEETYHLTGCSFKIRTRSIVTFVI